MASLIARALAAETAKVGKAGVRLTSQPRRRSVERSETERQRSLKSTESQVLDILAAIDRGELRLSTRRDRWLNALKAISWVSEDTGGVELTVAGRGALLSAGAPRPRIQAILDPN